MKPAARRVLACGTLAVLGCAASLVGATVMASGQLPPPPTLPAPPSLPPAPEPAPSLPPAPSTPSAPPFPAESTRAPAVAETSGALTGSSAAGSVSPSTLSSEATAPVAPRGAAASPGSPRTEPTFSGRATAIRSKSGRRGVAIPFALQRPTRVLVVVRGPLPRCEAVARLNVRGRRGQNRIRFFGQVRGRALDPGTYVIGLRPVRSKRPRWTGVQVGEDGARAISRAETAGAVAHCTTAPPIETSHLALLTIVKRGDVVTHSLPASSGPTAQPKRPASVDVVPERGGVLPAIHVPDDLLPPVPGELPLAVGIAALGLLALSGLGMIVFLVRFLRRGDEA